MPLHSNTIKPVNATATKNRVRVRIFSNVLHGGNLAFADFHVTPPFGMSIVKKLYCITREIESDAPSNRVASKSSSPREPTNERGQ